MVIAPELEHFMIKRKNYEDARDNFKKQQYTKGNFNFSIAEETINWPKKH